MKHLIFVYGTLMKGQRAYGVFGNMKYFNDGVLRDYGLYETGDYPAAVPVKGFNVYGELYEIDDATLKKFDDYEDEGDLYIRKLVKIQTDNKEYDAWFYEYIKDVSKMELRDPVGKWTPERRPYVHR